MERFNPVNPARIAEQSAAGGPARSASHNIAGGPGSLKTETLTNSLESFSKETVKPKSYFVDRPSTDPLLKGPMGKSVNEPTSPVSGPVRNTAYNVAGGPQFGQSDGWGNKFRSWLSKYGSSVFLPVIAILILAGGIYLYATRTTQENPNPTANISEEAINEMIEPIKGEPEKITKSEESTEAPKTEESQIEEIVPEPAVKKEGQIIEKAIKGDGITHLARRALKDYLKDNPQELSKEHKIYIEDYLKDKEGPRPLEVEDEISFKENLIKEAIDASLKLTPNQLKTLEKYSALVTNL